MQNKLCNKQERQLVFIQFASCLFVDLVLLVTFGNNVHNITECIVIRYM